MPFVAIVARVLVGLVCFALLWWAAYAWEDRGETAVFLGVAAACIVAAVGVGASISVARASMRLVLSLLFAGGFLAAAAVSAAAIADGVFRPFVFWLIASVVMIAASYIGSLFRLRRHDASSKA
jgi:hypothetical protein